jgi:hypothetical protein
MDFGGLLGNMALGGVAGASKGRLDELVAETERAEKEGMLRLQQQYRAEERGWRQEDAATERGWQQEDAATKRGWQQEDADKQYGRDVERDDKTFERQQGLLESGEEREISSYRKKKAIDNEYAKPAINEKIEYDKFLLGLPPEDRKVIQKVEKGGELTANERVKFQQSVDEFSYKVATRDGTAPLDEKLYKTTREETAKRWSSEGAGVQGGSGEMGNFLASLLGKDVGGSPASPKATGGTVPEGLLEEAPPKDMEAARQRATQASEKYRSEKEAAKAEKTLKEEMGELAKKKRKSKLTAAEDARFQELKAILMD